MSMINSKPTMPVKKANGSRPISAQQKPFETLKSPAQDFGKSGGDEFGDNHLDSKPATAPFNGNKTLPAPTGKLLAAAKPPGEDFQRIISKPFDLKSKKSLNELSSGGSGILDTQHTINQEKTSVSNVSENNGFSDRFWKVNNSKPGSKTPHVGPTSTKNTTELKPAGLSKKKSSVKESRENEPEDAGIGPINLSKSTLDIPILKQVDEMLSNRSSIALDLERFVTDMKTKAVFPENFDEDVDVETEELLATQNDITQHDVSETQSMTNSAVHPQAQNFMSPMKKVNEATNGKPLTKEEEAKNKEYAKELERVKKNDLLLAQKEKEYRNMKRKLQAETINRMDTAVNDMKRDEASISDVMSRVFVTAPRMKGSATNRSYMEEEEAPASPEEKKVETKGMQSTKKPKPVYEKDFINKNIENAFKKEESKLDALTELQQARLGDLMKDIDSYIDKLNDDINLDHIDQAAKRPNPFDLSQVDRERSLEIDSKLSRLQDDHEALGINHAYNPVDKANLPKDKNLFDVAVDRLIHERAAYLNKNLLELSVKDRDKVKEDEAKIAKLANLLKANPVTLPVEWRAPRLEDNPYYAELESTKKEAEKLLTSLEKSNIRNEMSALGADIEACTKLIKEAKTLVEDHNHRRHVEEAQTAKRDFLRKYIEDIDKEREKVRVMLDNTNEMEHKIHLNIEDTLRDLMGGQTVDPEQVVELPPEKQTEIDEIVNLHKVDKTIEDYDNEILQKLIETQPELFARVELTLLNSPAHEDGARD